MHIVSAPVLDGWTLLSDEQVVTRVLAGQTALFEILMRRHNERIYRAARAILRGRYGGGGRDAAGVRERIYTPAAVRWSRAVRHLAHADCGARSARTGAATRPLRIAGRLLYGNAHAHPIRSGPRTPGVRTGARDVNRVSGRQAG